MAENRIIETLKLMSEMYGRNISPAAATMFAGDLSGYPEPEVLKSLGRCRKEIPRFPTVAEIVARIDDSRPGVEEAWGMVPKDEYASVVWTGEMAAAFNSARPLMDDPIAARMAFKETYEKRLAEARSVGRPPVWEVSLGHDPNHREIAVLEAVHKNRISSDYASKILPKLIGSPQLAAIEDGTVKQRDVAGLLTNMTKGKP